MPLYLVTMASQNLPGFAVLRATGYTPPVRPALLVTGGGSALAALWGAHTFNMAAITAAICLDPSTEPDPTRRWRVGVVYGAFWVALGLMGSLILPAILAMPPEIVATVAGLALIAPLIGAAAQAFEPTRDPLRRRRHLRDHRLRCRRLRHRRGVLGASRGAHGHGA